MQGQKKHIITKRNHYNPCLWTSLWNKDYYYSIKNVINSKKRARDYKIPTLTIFSKKVSHIKTESLYYEMYRGIIYATTAELKMLIENNHGNLRSVSLYNRIIVLYFYWLFPRRTYGLDTESLFNGIEDVTIKDAIYELIKHDRISNDKHKAYISSFILTHQLRSPMLYSRLMKKHKATSNPHLNAFIDFSMALRNEIGMYQSIQTISKCHWKLYITESNTLPLSDLPIYEDNKEIIAVLSPRHLLVIDKQIRTEGIIQFDSIDDILLQRINSLMINQTWSAFSINDITLLKQVLASDLWKQRQLFLKSNI